MAAGANATASRPPPGSRSTRSTTTRASQARTPPFDERARPRAARASSRSRAACSHDVPRAPLDDAAVRRLRHRRGVQPALPLPARLAGRPGSRWPSTCRRRWGATPTTRSRAARSAASASRSRSLDDMHAAARRAPARRGLHLDDHQRHRGDAARALRRRRRRARRPAAPARRHDPERHPQGVHRARHVHLPAARRRCGSSPTSSPSAARELPRWNTITISGYHIREAGCDAVQEVAFTLADGIAYVEAARARRASTSTPSRRGSRSSSTRTTTSSRRWPSSAPRGGCGRASCATASARATRARRCCASTPRRPARR